MWERLQTTLSDPSFWKIEHCCFAWDLKAGSIISTLTGFTVIFCAFITVTSQFQILYTDVESDIFKTLKGYQAIHYTLAYLYLLLGLVAFGVSFLGSYMGHYMLTRVGTCLTGATFIFWLLLTITSYYQNNYRIVCIQSRCPDLHWFVESRWRNFGYKDCKSSGDRYGMTPKPIPPPINLPYPRWFTDRNFYNLTPLTKIYLEYIKQHWNNTKLSNITGQRSSRQTGNMEAIFKQKMNINPLNSSLSKRTIRNKNRSKINQLKRNKRRKKHRKAFRRKLGTNSKIFMKKYQGGELGAEEEEEEEEEGEEEEESKEKESNGQEYGVYDKITYYIPLYKLAPPVELIFKGFSIFLALSWGVFMTNTLIVLIYYMILLNEELPVGEEDEEDTSEDY